LRKVPGGNWGKHGLENKIGDSVVRVSIDGQKRRALEPRWCPTGLTKMQRRKLQKLHKSELEKERAENAHDDWFNQARPMSVPRKTWREKRLAREEISSSKDSDHDSDGALNKLEVNMVFELPVEFWAPDEGVVELALGAKAVMFHKLEKLGTHMQPLFITGYLRGVPVQ
jgi:hypothetical protein